MRCQTKFEKNILDEDRATALYYFLRENIEWEEGIRSKKGFTRKAKDIQTGQIVEVDNIISEVLTKMSKNKYLILGFYVNYYENGEMWTPNHSHPGTHQLVISLGQTRTLTLGKKSYEMNNGSAIIFGSSTHGVPKDDSVEGRISIATFMLPLK
jgi:hypothetical protein